MMPGFAPQARQMPYPGESMLEEDTPPVEPVVFLEAPTELEKEPSHVATMIKAAEKATAAKPVKVKVIAPYRVMHQAKPFVGGDTVEVPADTADSWVKSGWVERVSGRK